MAPPSSRPRAVAAQCPDSCRRLVRRRPLAVAYLSLAVAGWTTVGVLRLVGVL